jgi:hypothetical protein
MRRCIGKCFAGGHALNQDPKILLTYVVSFYRQNAPAVWLARFLIIITVPA